MLAGLDCSTTALGAGTTAYICLELEIKDESGQEDPDPKRYGTMVIVRQRQLDDERLFSDTMRLVKHVKQRN
jgi:hypothetical protein